MSITKAVIPAAGFGTRFLPATKAVPKELLPVGEKPVIQYVVEEAVAAEITDILIVTGPGKHAIEDHFTRNGELEALLERQGKTEVLEQVRAIHNMAEFHFVYQHEMKGLGHAIARSRAFTGSDPFAVLLGDTILESRNHRSVIGQLVDVHKTKGGSVVACEEVPLDRVSRYGVIDGLDTEDPKVKRVQGMVEKPLPEEAPSNLVVASRYIFDARIHQELLQTEPGKGGEIQITDAMDALLRKDPLHARRIDGRRHDVGNPTGLIAAAQALLKVS